MKYAVLILMIVALLGIFIDGFFYDKSTDKPAACISHCTERGFGASYCKERCSPSSYATDAHKAPQVADPACQRNCQSSGRTDVDCAKACTYF